MIYVFDVDGVLCESKTDIDNEMAMLLEELSQTNTIVFLTGGKFEQVSNQVMAHTNIKRPFYILPLSGADGWSMGEENIQLWNNNLSDDEKGRIFAGIIHVISNNTNKPFMSWGGITEDRGSQITLSLLGMNAPWNIKKYYDPDRKIRSELGLKLVNTIIGSSDFTFTIGGSTSIDITKKGVNKGNSLLNLQKVQGWETKDIVFVGDNLQPGGNDYPVLQAGFTSIHVKSPEDTKRYMKAWLTHEIKGESKIE